MTAAESAFSEKMSRLSLDLKLREINLRRLMQQAEAGCHCPEFYWKPELPKLQWVYPFVSRPSPGGILYEQLQILYCAYVLQSRLFAQLEVFELPLDFPKLDPLPWVKLCSAAELETLEASLEAGSCTVVFRDSEESLRMPPKRVDKRVEHELASESQTKAEAVSRLWSRRNHVVQSFLRSMKRQVDIVRLSLAAGLNALPPDKWYPLGERHFLLMGNPLQVRADWVVAKVFEANSADFDKV